MTKVEQYFKDVNSIVHLDKLSEERVDQLLSKLIKCLPDNGLLYKYKDISVNNEEEFNKIYNPLNEGYLYLPSPEQMNDKIDTTFVYKTLHNEKDIYLYHYNNRYKIHYYNLKAKEKVNSDRLFVLQGLASAKSDYQIASELKKKYRGLSTKLQFVNKVKREIDELYGNQRNLKAFVDSYNELITNLRHDLCIYCFTESYKQDSMWAYYGGKNNGLCIVYDFKKAFNLKLETKRLLIAMGKIKYSDEKREIDVLDIYDFIYANEASNKKFKSLSFKLSQALYTKSKSWSHEKEWRLLKNKQQHKIYADLVAGLIIDEDISDSENAKRLIELAIRRHWFVKIRQLNNETMKYEYVELSHLDNE